MKAGEQRKGYGNKEPMAKVTEVLKADGRQKLGMNDLDGISGGKITPEAAEAFNALIISLKKYNHSLESCIDFVQTTLSFDTPLFEEATKDEVVAYIKANWDIL